MEIQWEGIGSHLIRLHCLYKGNEELEIVSIKSNRDVNSIIIRGLSCFLVTREDVGKFASIVGEEWPPYKVSYFVLAHNNTHDVFVDSRDLHSLDVTIEQYVELFKIFENEKPNFLHPCHNWGKVKEDLQKFRTAFVSFGINPMRESSRSVLNKTYNELKIHSEIFGDYHTGNGHHLILPIKSIEDVTNVSSKNLLEKSMEV